MPSIAAEASLSRAVGIAALVLQEFGVAVAVNVTGLPAIPVPAAVAVSVFTPTLGPSIQLPTAAIPLVLVSWLAPVMLPPPEATVNVTATFGTGLPLASVTSTAGWVGTALPAPVDWLSPAVTAIAAAGPTLSAIAFETTPL